jgi:hypothetical protein
MKYALKEGIGKLASKLGFFRYQNMAGDAKLNFEPSMPCPPGTTKHAHISIFPVVYPRMVADSPSSRRLVPSKFPRFEVSEL